MTLTIMRLRIDSSNNDSNNKDTVDKFSNNNNANLFAQNCN